ncbi:MAG TPA: SpoIIE family protein phosphatase [Symbiobacteriaceae bacterium]|nr:SpoIIE family protein phosphatase [Symbiobacteriaceae bacterium]
MALLWQPFQLACMLVGFLLGRMFPSSGLAPVGLAFFGAVRGAGFSPLSTGLVGLSVLAGGALELYPKDLQVLIALFLGLLLAFSISAKLKLAPGQTAPLLAVILGALPVGIAGAAGIGLSGLNTGQLTTPLLSNLLWTAIAGCLALLFSYALVEIQTGQWLRATEADQPMANLILLSAIMTSLHLLLPLGWPSLRDVAALLVVLLAAFSSGPSLGALYGGVFAMMVILFPAQDVKMPWQMAVTMQTGLMEGLTHGMGYVAAGVLAGTFRVWYGRIGAGLAGLGGMLLMILALSTDPALMQAALIAGAISVGLFWLLPPSWVKRIGRGLTRQGEAGAPPADMSGLVTRLEGLVRVLRQAGQSAQEMAAVAEPLQAEPVERADGALRTIYEQLCEGCGMRDECWRQFPERTGLILTELWSELEEEGRLPLAPLPAPLTDICIYPDQVVSLLNLAWEQGLSRRQLVQQLSEHRQMAVGWLKEVATLLEGVMEGEKLPGVREKRPPVFSLSVSAAARPQMPGSVSGDIYLSEPLADGRHLLLLGDGMGVGSTAAQVSSTAAAMLHDLLAAGMDLAPAVRTLNALLLLQAKEERFTTLDVALVDLTDGRCRFAKSGAAPTFIKRGELVSVVRGESLPVGILPEAPVETVGRVLRGGDLLVFLTDGLWEAVATQEGPDWVEVFLRAVPTEDPSELVEALLARVEESVGEPRDDRSVLVVRVEAMPGQRRVTVKRPRRTAAKAERKEQEEPSPTLDVVKPQRTRKTAKDDQQEDLAVAPPPTAVEQTPAAEPVTSAESSTWVPVRVANIRTVRRNTPTGGS